MSGKADNTHRLESLLAMGKRLADAIEADIDSLERGAFNELRSTTPEMIQLSARYAQEVAAVKQSGGVGNAPAALVKSLRETGTRLKTALQTHDRIVLALRQASEGLVQTVAEEVEKQRKQAAPYNPKAAPKTAGGAIVYDKVV
jgi:hypothetical protein